MGSPAEVQGSEVATRKQMSASEDVVVFNKECFFTDSSLQASQQGTKKQEVTKEEEKRRIEAKESDTSTTRPRYETSFDE